ncbi:AraC-like DNA-binding protein [Hymenobacter luteus]|uniref:AraC-like DNA-binding protein n=2 Tax=Hymenobacter TaxID=89966 RepID=A0A7W9T4M8_9BACT|nr:MULTISPECIES: AraC family transcriptional regulator [Hymenobacter]MBB4603732.1 AraC-like DNA-binding protein [Hymenobacter latericoloratus]MBB6061512.1 AraC-like DNA-binding protein [Hymenobacter luteus]
MGSLPAPALPEVHSAGSFTARYMNAFGHAEGAVLAPFQLYRVEEVASHLRVPTAPHRPAFHAFLLLTQGSSENLRGVQRVAVRAHTVLLLPAGLVTATFAFSPDVRGFFCLFEPTFLAQALPGGPDLLPELAFLTLDEQPMLVLSAAESHRLAALLHVLHQEYQAQAPTAVLGALLYAALLGLRRPYERAAAAPSPPGSSAEHLTRRFLTLLARPAGPPRTVDAFADALAVTPNYLSRCARQVTGRPASAWISSAQVQEAQLLLRHSQLSVTAIAEQVGFADTSYFGRFFRQHTGYTPSDYRKQA